MSARLPLFEPPPELPAGFRYQAEFLSPDEERDVLRQVNTMAFDAFVMRGVEARRRVVHLGYRYGFDTRGLEPGPPLPPFVQALRDRVGEFAGKPAGAFAEALVTQYPPGATIGWHRDAPPFDVVVGISLAAPCRFRFRRGPSGARETREIVLEPRSIYVLDGPARTEWEHSIAAVPALRYSITFRTLRRRPPALDSA